MSNFLFILEPDQSKPSLKEDSDNSTTKIDDKSSSNPLANLASTVNSIPNGISSNEESAVSISLPMNVNSKQAPLKAMVKPQVLTHVIEGFVIQEGKLEQSNHLIKITFNSFENVLYSTRIISKNNLLTM